MAYEDVEFYDVDSSNIASIGYDGEEMVLYVTFNSGRTYWYSDVPYGVWEGFLSAPSMGKYFHQNIRNVYAYGQMS